MAETNIRIPGSYSNAPEHPQHKNWEKKNYCHNKYITNLYIGLQFIIKHWLKTFQNSKTRHYNNRIIRGQSINLKFYTVSWLQKIILDFKNKHVFSPLKLSLEAQTCWNQYFHDLNSKTKPTEYRMLTDGQQTCNRYSIQLYVTACMSTQGKNSEWCLPPKASTRFEFHRWIRLALKHAYSNIDHDRLEDRRVRISHLRPEIMCFLHLSGPTEPWTATCF